MNIRQSRISIALESRKKIILILNTQLANILDLHSQTKNAHWNLRGPFFYPLHKLFDELAEMIHEHSDTLAERITTLGGIAEGSMRKAVCNSKIQELPENLSDGQEFVSALASCFAEAASQCRAGIDECSNLGDQVAADLLTTITADLDKGLWFLDAHQAA